MLAKSPYTAEGVILREPKASGGSNGTTGTTLAGCAVVALRFSRLALLDGKMTFE